MNVCFFGDSIVNGVGDPEGLGWVGRLLAAARGQGCAMTAYNLGVRRNTSADVLARWQDELERRLMPGAPMHLVFAFGAVDMVLQSDAPGTPLVPLEQSLENARTILEKAVASYPTLFVGPPVMADPALTFRIEELSQAYGALCQELGVPFMPLAPELKDAELYLDDLIQGDGIHPSRAGYGHIFRVVETWQAWQDWLQPKD